MPSNQSFPSIVLRTSSFLQDRGTIDLASIILCARLELLGDISFLSTTGRMAEAAIARNSPAADGSFDITAGTGTVCSGAFRSDGEAAPAENFTKAVFPLDFVPKGSIAILKKRSPGEQVGAFDIASLFAGLGVVQTLR